MTLDRFLAYLVGLVAALILVVLAITQSAPSTLGPDRAAAAYMLQLVNEARGAEDLPPLRAAEDIAVVAEGWSEVMAADQYMRHNPNFSREICCWRSATENVAWSEPHRFWMPGDPVLRLTDELHAALMNSPSHRDNLLDSAVDQIGIGVHVDANGNVWITQNFRHFDGS